MAAVAADPRMRSGVSRCALGCATVSGGWASSGTRPRRSSARKPGQNQEIEQHIDKHRNEGDCEHRDLGEKEPPENVFVAERTEPQQFGRPIDEREQDNKKIPPSSAKPTGERNKRRQGLVKGAPTAQGSFSLSVTSSHAAHLPLPMLELRMRYGSKPHRRRGKFERYDAIIDPVTGGCLIESGVDRI